MLTAWRLWKYKNLTFLALSIMFAGYLAGLDSFKAFLLALGEWGYIGAFLGGMLFVVSFTITLGGLILFVLAEKLSPLEVAIVGGLGAVVSDFVIFHFVKDNLVQEIAPIYDKLGGSHLTRFAHALLHTKHFHWAIPLIGAVLIASPFPDEVGVSMMGLSHVKTYQFLIVALILNTIGIFFVVTAGSIVGK